ncbi:MAG TPA: type III-B CRISPR module-associated protein Cmr5 [Pseudonocardiaceae bacterium]|nr:type III-B CRISPR module-associated protein Cmr5 [Pseudonocardiaceae bacterium]
MAERVDHGLARAAANALRDQDITDELRTRMRGLPAMLQTSGLAATCAFLLAKAKNHERSDAYWLTAKTLLDEAAGAAGIDPNPDPNLTLDALSQATGPQYVLAETRAAMLALWLSRLAQAKVIAQKEKA